MLGGVCIVNNGVNKQDLTFEIYVDTSLFGKEELVIDLKETIIHELIHTCNRCLGHGKTWMKYAKIMDEKYGYELTTFKDINAVLNKENPVLHHYVCPQCENLYNERVEREKIPNLYLLCPFYHSYYKQID